METETEINLEEQALNTNEDEQILDEGDKDKDLTGDEKKEADKEKPSEPSLEDRIAGLETGISKERDKRRTATTESATLKGQLQGIQDVLAESMARREETEAATGKKPETDAITDLIVELNDDGGAVLPGKAFDAAVTAKVKEILESQGIASNKKNVEELREEILLDQEEQAQTRDFKEHRDFLLTDEENVPFAGNYPKLDIAQRWFKSQILKYQGDNQIQRSFSAGEAIDVAMKEGISETFAKKFPTLDFVSVARMYESDYDFGQALKSLSGGNTDKGKADLSKLQKLANKASNLSGVPSQKAVGGDLTLESITGMTTAEMEKLTPEDEEKIEKILAGPNA